VKGKVRGWDGMMKRVRERTFGQIGLHNADTCMGDRRCLERIRGLSLPTRGGVEENCGTRGAGRGHLRERICLATC
jgi:hypothetical protein